jgi:hypothetical protein
MEFIRRLSDYVGSFEKKPLKIDGSGSGSSGGTSSSAKSGAATVAAAAVGVIGGTS